MFLLSFYISIKVIFIKLFFMLNILFIFSNNPIMSINLIIFFSILLMIFFSIFLKNSWFSLIFILMMLGGLIILFMYMASLASNEPFFSKINMLFFFYPCLIFLLPYKMNLFYNSTSSFSINYMFSSFICWNNILALIYLLFSLIFILELMQYNKSTLRSKMLSNKKN